MKHLLPPIIISLLIAGCSTPQCNCNCGKCKYSTNYDSYEADSTRPISEMTPWWKENN